MIPKRWFFSIATVYFIITSGLAAADDVLLRWHANIEPDLQGYNIYYGTQSESYGPPISVGKITEYTVSNLEPGTTYYFAISALDIAGNESTYSSEKSIVTHDVDNQAPIVSVTSSTDDGNVAANTIDNNLATRWSAEGSGQWIQYDLGATHSISGVLIAFYRGDSRTSDFEILFSDDAQSWNSVFRGQSSGTTLHQEKYVITDATGRFVRIVGNGNSSNTWNSITEVDIVGDRYTPPADTTNPTIAITAPTTAATFSTASGTLSFGGTADDDRALQTVIWSASDGQSGTANGTTNWSTGSVQLAEGNTTFTVIATDVAGNQATDTLTVTYTPADTQKPTIAINTPTTDTAFHTASGTLNIGGTAADDRVLQTVTWSASDGQSGTASGTANWSTGSIQLAEGNTTFTVIATDAAGNNATDTLTVIYMPADTTNPTIAITAPTTAATFSTASDTVSLGGTADDDRGLQTVTWSTSGGQRGTASGRTNWSIDAIDLLPGPNVITVTATDAAGNSGQDSVIITYTRPEVYTWTGAINSDWEESGNWDVGEVPGDDANVIFPAGCLQAIHSPLSGTSNIDQLSCSGQLIISGGSLTIDGDSRVK